MPRTFLPNNIWLASSSTGSKFNTLGTAGSAVPRLGQEYWPTTRSNPGWRFGDTGFARQKPEREGEGSPCRLFEPQIRSADRYQAGLPNVTARPHGAWECGWELPEYGLCGSSYFLGATHLVCLGVRIDPNCFAASHMRLEVEWKEISNTQLVGGRGVRRGQHSKANYCTEIFA